MLLLAAGVAGRAGDARSAQPQDALRATLPNGLRVVIVRDALAPVATVEMNLLVGG